MLNNSLKLNLVALAAQANQLAVTSTQTTLNDIQAFGDDVETVGGHIDTGKTLIDIGSDVDEEEVETIINVAADLAGNSNISGGFSIVTNFTDPANTQYAKYTGCQAKQVFQNSEFKGCHKPDMRQEGLMCFDDPCDEYDCLAKVCSTQIRQTCPSGFADAHPVCIKPITFNQIGYAVMGWCESCSSGWWGKSCSNYWC